MFFETNNMVIVHTQEEFDALPKSMSMFTEIQLIGPIFFINRTIDGARLELRGKSKATITCGHIIAYDESEILANDAMVTARDKSKVTATKASVHAYNEAVVHTIGQCRVYARDHSKLICEDNASVMVEGDAQAMCSDRCDISAWGNAIVECKGNCMITVHNTVTLILHNDQHVVEETLVSNKKSKVMILRLYSEESRDIHKRLFEPEED